MFQSLTLSSFFFLSFLLSSFFLYPFFPIFFFSFVVRLPDVTVLASIITQWLPIVNRKTDDDDDEVNVNNNNDDDSDDDGNDNDDDENIHSQSNWIQLDPFVGGEGMSKNTVRTMSFGMFCKF